MTNTVLLLTGVIDKAPGVIVGPVTNFLGVILDFLFNITFGFIQSNSLGISIILLTIVARTLMLPLSFKQQKSMLAMQKLQPEMAKIKARYGDTKDPELQRKMNTEIQQLYSKNKANPFGGCLPLLVTFPIFIALSYSMRQSYLFISTLGDMYRRLAEKIYEIPDYISIVRPLVLDSGMVPNKMRIDLAVTEDLMACINKFTTSMWNDIIANAPSDIGQSISTMLLEKQNIEYFFGINLVEYSGLAFPGILIPILTAATTFLSSWLMNRQNKAMDANAQMTQKMMLFVMPIMIGVMTVNFSAGVGLYWIVSSIYQIVQQPLITKYYQLKKQ